MALPGTIRRGDRKAHGDDPVSGIEAELAALWPDGEGRTVVWPLTLRVGRV